MPNLPTFRDAVQLRLRNMSPRKAYVPESANLQLELVRNSWGKSPYGRKKWEMFRGESSDCSSSYLNPGSIGGVTPSASQHCFISGDTTGISGLFPNNWVYLHWRPLSPGMQKSQGRSKISIMMTRESPQAAANSFPLKELHSEMAEPTLSLSHPPSG